MELCNLSRGILPLCLPVGDKGSMQRPPKASRRGPWGCAQFLEMLCGRGRGLPGPRVAWFCPGRFGRGKPLPYAPQSKKSGNFRAFPGSKVSPWREPAYSSSSFNTAMKASEGICTVPKLRIFFLPSFCFSSSFFFRVMSPP